MLRIAVGRGSAARWAAWPPALKTQFGHKLSTTGDRFSDVQALASNFSNPPMTPLRQLYLEPLILRLRDAIAYGVYLRQRELSDDEIASMLESIHASFSGEAEADPALRLEVARTVAGDKFKLLGRRSNDFDVVNDLHQRVLALGFSNLKDEGTVGIFYAMHCMKFKRLAEAKTVLEALLRKADDRALGPPSVRKELAQDATRLMGELSHAGG